MTTVECECGYTREFYDPKNANTLAYLHGRKCDAASWPTVEVAR